MSFTVRQATDDDGQAIRRLVTEALLLAGFDAPTPDRDDDLLDLSYYREPGRGMWVAIDEQERVIGCAAIDRGDGGFATLRRLAGSAMPELTAAAVAFAQGRGYAGVETVIPAAMAEARDAVRLEGFASEGSGNDLLFRKAL
jgi:N-acetylglutamate synthase-like GNAT family acetyltransferase